MIFISGPWFDPKPISWIGNTPYSEYGAGWVAATHVRKNSSGPIKPLAQFVETRMRRKVSGMVNRRLATKMTLMTANRIPIAVSLTGRVALRVLPVVGWALLAYDLYTVGDALHDWYKDDN